MFELTERLSPQPVIKAFGIGGEGGKAIAHLITSGVVGIDFVYVDTDRLALEASWGCTPFLLGGNVAEGGGTGGNPQIGKRAAIEDRESLRGLLYGSDMVFICAGMGGGTGTGAAPVVAQLAKELGILTVAVVTEPSPPEGNKQSQTARAGIEVLLQYVDSLIAIPTEEPDPLLRRNAGALEAIHEVNELLLVAVRGIVELIVRPGLINVDFADIRMSMGEMGMAAAGLGVAAGDHRATVAVEAAINGALLKKIDLASACSILVNVTSGPDLTMSEFDEIGYIVHGAVSEEATVMIGTVLDPDIASEVRVTIIAAGLDRARATGRSIPSTQKSSPAVGSGDDLAVPAVLRAQTKKVDVAAINSDSIRIVAHPDIPDRTLALLVEVLSALYAGVSNDVLIVSKAIPIPSTPVREQKANEKTSKKTATGM